MGCNTSQEQKTHVADNGDVDVNDETNQHHDNNDTRNSAKSGKSVKSSTNVKTVKLSNGHADKDDGDSEGM